MVEGKFVKANILAFVGIALSKVQGTKPDLKFYGDDPDREAVRVVNPDKNDRVLFHSIEDDKEWRHILGETIGDVKIEHFENEDPADLIPPRKAEEKDPNLVGAFCWTRIKLITTNKSISLLWYGRDNGSGQTKPQFQVFVPDPVKKTA